MMNYRKKIFVLGVVIVFVCYAADAQSWQQCNSLPEALSPRAVVVHGKIYAVSTGAIASTAPVPMYIYDPALDTWTKKGEMHAYRAEFELVETDGRIFAFGGYAANGMSLTTVEEFDTLSGTWIDKNNMPIPCYDVGAATYNGKIYLFGGSRVEPDKNVACNDVLEYDPQSDAWTIKASMLKARRGPSIVNIKNKIYAISGWNTGFSATEGLEEYDISNNVWTEKANYASAPGKYFCKAEAVNDKIYSVFTAGSNAPTDTYVSEYDPSNDTWTVRLHTTPASYFTKLFMGNKIYMFGGMTRTRSLSNKAVAYDPISNTISSLPDLSEAKWFCGAVNLLGKIFVIGGCLNWGGTNYDRVEAYDTNNTPSSVRTEYSNPESLLFQQNYPNPFNPSTIIHYRLPKAGPVTLKVFDTLGRELAILVNEIQTPGSHSYLWSANGLPSGVYLVVMRTGSTCETIKVALVK